MYLDGSLVNSFIFVKPVLRELKRQNSGLLTQVNYSEKNTFGGLKGRSLNTGGIFPSNTYTARPVCWRE